VTGLLLDLDGTLYVGDAALPGAVEAIRAIAERGIPRRYLTNTTRLSRRGIAELLGRMGFAIDEEEIFTAPLAAKGWMASRGIGRVALYVPEATHEDFAGLEVVTEAPEAIVVGDLGDGWTFGRLNEAFRHLLDGAALVALQKNRYWRTGDGLALDAGPFVCALEYAADREAVVVGKPSPDFFRLAAASLGLPAEEVTVIGDDVEADVAGAQAAGMRGVLVRTGKYRPEVLARSGVRPARVADSLAEAVREVLAE
jgi:phospholysine phosphohistidine inorganic pyrophosphate phosphatase